MANESVQVRVEFEGDLLKKLNRLKLYYGVENYTELIRLIVKDKDREIFPKEA